MRFVFSCINLPALDTACRARAAGPGSATTTVTTRSETKFQACKIKCSALEYHRDTGSPSLGGMARARSHRDGLIHLPESRCTGPLARYAQLRYHSHGHSVLGSGSAAGQPQARADSDSTERPGTGRPACHWPAYPRGRPGRGRGSTVTVQASEVGLAAVTVTAWPQHFLPVLHSLRLNIGMSLVPNLL